MPLVDGALSARMIRFWEKETQHRPPSDERQPQVPKNRVPIIAVTDNLNEDSRFEYIQSGYVSSTLCFRVLMLTLTFRFDGWAAKPLDLRRLDLMLQGVLDAGMKRDSLYTPGQEIGGWFFP
jgi:hypothetical protein